MKNDILNKPIIHNVRRKNVGKTQQGRKKMPGKMSENGKWLYKIADSITTHWPTKNGTINFQLVSRYCYYARKFIIIFSLKFSSRLSSFSQLMLILHYQNKFMICTWKKKTEHLKRNDNIWNETAAVIGRQQQQQQHLLPTNPNWQWQERKKSDEWKPKTRHRFNEWETKITGSNGSKVFALHCYKIANVT